MKYKIKNEKRAINMNIYSDFTNTEEWGIVHDLTLESVTYDLTVDEEDNFAHKFIPKFAEISSDIHLFTAEVWQDLDGGFEVVLFDGEYNSYFRLPTEQEEIVINEFNRIKKYIK